MDDESAVNLLPFHLEGEAMECFNSLEEGELKSLKKVFKKLQSRFCPASFKLIIHEKLCSEKMGENEKIEEYIT